MIKFLQENMGRLFDINHSKIFLLTSQGNGNKNKQIGPS